MTVTRSCSLLALLLLLPTEVVGMAVRPKLTVFRTGPQLRPPARETPAADAGARDVMLKLYDISSPPLVSAFQALAFKEGFWFPKLSIGETYDGILERVSGGKPLRTINCGPTSKSDAQIAQIIAEMGATDYTQDRDEYCFFFRNCNHFALDLAERLADGGEADAAFIDAHVLHESEAILSDLPLGALQQTLTRQITRQVQLVVIKSWRKEWKRQLAEYEEEQGIPLEERKVYAKQ
ncbi:hypothetical protein EMIHUDRAFT_220070 [Emiliania huxleyi CCMP1516]|uniref:PPPDE domain-containing protein n=2 Tax=Emiliania huxleyi TaxID=2903 RepID=A0A0D3I2Y9_EMIH1|nr:hypothetical protein EMIHUDRAFT_220070 [Emiliania huxleyi CCMP1516]EOD05624.1 hypothetical protein EMIHUDRAFT_220070 [Emiliania huxleyi CCMP1516]|eukprot:XP_005758053.1 hypothetical protein EMIHUDRAFT_220070 [Emiliania huxleyi CCMP1516]